MECPVSDIGRWTSGEQWRSCSSIFWHNQTMSLANTEEKQIFEQMVKSSVRYLKISIYQSSGYRPDFLYKNKTASRYSYAFPIIMLWQANLHCKLPWKLPLSISLRATGARRFAWEAPSLKSFLRLFTPPKPRVFVKKVPILIWIYKIIYSEFLCTVLMVLFALEDCILNLQMRWGFFWFYHYQHQWR